MSWISSRRCVPLAGMLDSLYYRVLREIKLCRVSRLCGSKKMETAVMESVECAVAMPHNLRSFTRCTA
jgi:hypothetical protein